MNGGERSAGFRVSTLLKVFQLYSVNLKKRAFKKFHQKAQCKSLW